MTRPPRWFVHVVVIALVWNLLGLFAVVSDVVAATSAPADAGPRSLASVRPLWSVVASLAAVVGGSLGCAALLMRSRWAPFLLAASLLGVVLQDVGIVLASGTGPAVNAVAIVLQGVVLVVAIGLLVLAYRAARAGWLR